MLFRKIDSLYSILLTRINMFSAFVIFAFMCLITADVIARSAFNSPIQGVAEIVGNGMVVLCFLQIPYVLMKGLHVRTTVLYDRFGHKGKCLLDAGACMLGMLAYILIISSSWGVMLRAIEINDAELAGTLRITNIPGRITVVGGSILMVIACMFQAIKSLMKIKDPSAFDEKKAPQASPAEGGSDK